MDGLVSPRSSRADNETALQALKRQQQRRLAVAQKPKVVDRNREGWMVKYERGYSERLFFILDYEEQLLKWFKSKESTSKPLGMIDLSSVKHVRNITIEKNPLAPAFSIRSVGKVNFFIPEDEKERNLWYKKFAALGAEIIEEPCMEFEVA